MRESYRFISFKKISLNFHKCTDADYDEFYPVSESEKDLYENFRSVQALYCIEAGQDMLIRGSSSMDFNALDIFLSPCKPNITEKTCLNNTLDKTKKYLGHPEFITLTNKKRVNTTKLDDRVIVKESRV